MIRVKIIRGVWRPSKVEPTVALPPTSNVSGPRPASVVAIEISAPCGAVTGQRRHYHGRTVLGEHLINPSGSAKRAVARSHRARCPRGRQCGPGEKGAFVGVIRTSAKASDFVWLPGLDSNQRPSD